MVKELYERIGLPKIFLLIFVLIILSGIGGIIFERIILPQLWTVPALRKLKFLDVRAPIVINNRQEIRINDSVNRQEVVSRVRSAAVRVYGQTSVSGLFVSNDGVIAIPNIGAAAGSEFTVLNSDGKFYPAALAATDEVFGLQFLKISAGSAPIINQGTSLDKNSGESLLVVSSAEQAGVMLAETVGLKVKTGIAGPSQIFSLARPNFGLALDKALGGDRLGSVIVDGDAALVGFVAQIDGSVFYLRAEDLRSSVDNFLKNSQNIKRSQMKLSYSIFDSVWAERSGFGPRYGVFVRSAAAPLSPGDFVYEADGRALSAEEDFQQTVFAKKPGEKVKFKLIRAGKQMEVEIIL